MSTLSGSMAVSFWTVQSLAHKCEAVNEKRAQCCQHHCRDIHFVLTGSQDAWEKHRWFQTVVSSLLLQRRGGRNPGNFPHDHLLIFPWSRYWFAQGGPANSAVNQSSALPLLDQVSFSVGEQHSEHASPACMLELHAPWQSSASEKVVFLFYPCSIHSPL